MLLLQQVPGHVRLLNFLSKLLVALVLLGGVSSAYAGTISGGSSGSTYKKSHALTNSPTCSLSSGTILSDDEYSSSSQLTGNQAPALPATGCLDQDIIGYDVTQGSGSYTFVPSTSRQCLRIPGLNGRPP